MLHNRFAKRSERGAKMAITREEYLSGVEDEEAYSPLDRKIESDKVNYERWTQSHDKDDFDKVPFDMRCDRIIDLDR